MKRWLTTLLGGYTGAGMVTFVLYRAAFARTRAARSWAESRGQEMATQLDELKLNLQALAGTTRQRAARSEDDLPSMTASTASGDPAVWRKLEGQTEARSAWRRPAPIQGRLASEQDEPANHAAKTVSHDQPDGLTHVA